MKQLIRKNIFFQEISDYEGPMTPSEVYGTHDINHYDGHSECGKCLSKTHGRSIDHPCYDTLDNPEEMGLTRYNYPSRQDRVVLWYSDGTWERLTSGPNRMFTQDYLDYLEDSLVQVS